MSSANDYPSYASMGPEAMEIGLQVARVGVGTVDYLADTLRLDALSANLFDLPVATDLPRDALHARIHPEDWPSIAEKVDILLDPDRDDVLDMTHRIIKPSGEIRWINARKRVRFERNGEKLTPLSGVFAVVDITERVQAENREKILLGELAHRAKNLFTVVLSIARQLKRYSSNEDFADRFIRRVEALARNQDAIVKGSERQFELTDIISQQLAPFEGQAQSRIHISGQSFPVLPDAAQVVAMITHELVTNAIKHGALSVPDGSVEVFLKVDEADDRFNFQWTEKDGPIVQEPEVEGYGTRVLTSLAKVSLQSDISAEYTAEGLRYELGIPLSRIRAKAD